MKQSTTQTAVPTTALAMKPGTTKKASKKASSTLLPATAAAQIPITVGLDLGDRHSHFCVLDAGGEPREQGKVAMSPKDLTAFFARVAPARLVLEVGGQSPWVSRLAQTAGLEVIVANPRRVQLITRNERKNDRTDAELLARLGRVDPKLLSPVQHRSAQCQADLAVNRARDVAVASRTALINHVRGAIKSYGQRLPTCSPDSFHKRVPAHLPVDLVPALTPIVQLIGQVSDQIRNFDARIEQLADGRYPDTKLLRQVSGVGPVTALTYVLTLDNPARVSHSRQVGPYIGLVPRRHDSGACTPQLRITKAGDPALRRLLVIAANYILGPFGPDCDLRRFGQKLAAQGGKNGRKRAKVAVARKLAVLLHHLWKTGEVYDPLHLAKKRGEVVPA
jgi:transposase